jgi:hypothetical protein
VTRWRATSARTGVIALSILWLACRAPEKEPAPAQAPQAEATAGNTGETGAAAGASDGTSATAATPPAATGPVAVAASPQECRARERKVEHLVFMVDMVENSDGAFQSAFDASTEALEGCLDSEPLWYDFARIAELGFGRFPMQVAGVRVADATEAAALALSHEPRSARIAVVDARAHGDIERARSALALDPGYAPARVALARALFERQQLDEALPLSDAPNVPGAGSLRAQILLARGDAAQAVRLARRELKAGWNAPEPYVMQAVRCDAQEALGLALHAQHARTAKSEVEKAAACGSARAAELLREMR